MTIKRHLQQRLKKLADGSSTSEILSLKFEDGQLECSMKEVGALGCLLDSLSWRSDWLAQAPFADLKTAAEKLVSRLTYLLEPIRLMEADEMGSQIQMRSFPPTIEDGSASYYEVSLGKEGATFRRWMRNRGQKRQAVPAQVTMEVLGRLAGDLSSVGR